MFLTLDEVRGERKQPIARKTLLGWIVLGPASVDGIGQVAYCKANLLLGSLQHSTLPMNSTKRPFRNRRSRQYLNNCCRKRALEEEASYSTGNNIRDRTS